MERRGSLLLVEDEDVLRGLVAQFLRNEGYEVVEAGDGAEGIRRFEQDGPFDLLLVDLKMPVLSGVEVCRQVKRVDPAQPILVCSAAITRESEEALHAVGVRHFLTKPYHPESLLAHIRLELVRRPESGASAGAAPAVKLPTLAPLGPA